MLALMVILLLAAAVIGGLMLQQPGPRRSAPAERSTEDFRAVSVVFDQEAACPAVRELALRRYLCSEAPLLPLPECTAGSCDCRFERHSDRRRGARRAAEKGVFERHFEGRDRRYEQRGRRAEDRGEEPVSDADQAAEFDPTATYYDFVAETGIDPQAGK